MESLFRVKPALAPVAEEAFLMSLETFAVNLDLEQLGTRLAIHPEMLSRDLTRLVVRLQCLLPEETLANSVK